jgi:hypothetical protein
LMRDSNNLVQQILARMTITHHSLYKFVLHKAMRYKCGIDAVLCCATSE